ncbi:ECF RNA polymerase sigma factor SigR [Rubritalea halochordaticola]|uniref:ECF RNA polymerase sigma factor SigR n=1 Tax=Rubritalea halochordaticola TaxID=714537 RepID=A0ABP9V4B6_9BACT
MSNSEFQDLVDQHYQALYRFAYSLAKSPDRAADLVQQTYCIWAQKGHQLKDKSKAKTWLFTTLYREHLGHARRQTRFPETDLDDVDYQLSTDDGERETARKMDGQRAVELLSQLDETFRAPLTLFYLQQHSYKEIAEILDVPMGTVMSRISRGKEQLRSKMRDEANDVPTKIISIQQQTNKHSHG